MPEQAGWRVGELARRVGLKPEVLRAWERRYGLLRPARTPGGFRVYSAADERRVRDVLALVAEGHSVAEAAGAVLGATGSASPEDGAEATAGDELSRIGTRLRRALADLQEGEAHAALDSLFAVTDLETALTMVILPELAELGRRWERGDATVADEHYASHVIGSRLLALGRGWDDGSGPRAVLACVPGERHTLGLTAFGLILRRRGWRIAFLGADTPLDSLRATVRDVRPAAVVVSAVDSRRFAHAAPGLRDLAREVRLLTGGAGSSARVAERVGGQALPEDPVRAADEMTALA